MKKHHDVQDIHFQGDRIVLTINGELKEYQLNDISPSLAKASERERDEFILSPSGYGIHWPLIDEDLSIDGLLGVVHDRSKKTEQV